MDHADGVLWPLATGPDRARWAAHALELYLRLARLILTRATSWPAAEQPVAAEALARTWSRFTRRSPAESMRLVAPPRRTRRAPAAAFGRSWNCREASTAWLGRLAATLFASGLSVAFAADDKKLTPQQEGMKSCNA